MSIPVFVIVNIVITTITISIAINIITSITTGNINDYRYDYSMLNRM